MSMRAVDALHRNSKSVARKAAVRKPAHELPESLRTKKYQPARAAAPHKTEKIRTEKRLDPATNCQAAWSTGYNGIIQ